MTIDERISRALFVDCATHCVLIFVVLAFGPLSVHQAALRGSLAFILFALAIGQIGLGAWALFLPDLFWKGVSYLVLSPVLLALDVTMTVALLS